MKIFKCQICGNIIDLLHNGGGTLVCCGQKMEEQVINSEEATYEKHIPNIIKEGNLVQVKVGSIIHPMIQEHYIEWVALVDEKGMTRKFFKPNEEPIVEFKTEFDEFTVYSYCNIHGFYKKEYK